MVESSFCDKMKRTRTSKGISLVDWQGSVIGPPSDWSLFYWETIGKRLIRSKEKERVDSDSGPSLGSLEKSSVAVQIEKAVSQDFKKSGVTQESIGLGP